MNNSINRYNKDGQLVCSLGFNRELKNYRIVKRHDNFFYIQRKILWWWKDLSTVNFNWHMRMWLFNKFATIEEAETYLIRKTKDAAPKPKDVVVKEYI